MLVIIEHKYKYYPKKEKNISIIKICNGTVCIRKMFLLH